MRFPRPLAAGLAPLVLFACTPRSSDPEPSEPGVRQEATAQPKASAAEASAFARKVNDDLKRLWTDWQRAEWVKSTYIMHDTELLAAKAHEEVMAYTAAAIKEAARFDGLDLDAETRRQLHLLKVSSTLPAPSDEQKRKRLAELASEMEALYGKGKYCAEGEDCRDLGQLSKVLAQSKSYDDMLEAWRGWRTVSPPMRPMYEEFVRLANEGAKEIGFEDVGELWRSAYDMSPADFEQESERLWKQVEPLYEALHCYVRSRLSQKYGADKVPPTGLIPAHLLGNMWAQEWSNVYPLVEPFKGAADLDVTGALVRKKYDEKEMVRLGERFFTSLGLEPLPPTFWERSQFVKPKDRDVVCHASAWDVTFDKDIRIKMCIKVDEEDLITIHHELGHNYYYMYYYNLPVLYQGGAHDGFHEGIGDTVALSVTPAYLKQVGILDKEPKKSKEALINLQMKEALERIAFLPFGKLIDQWRWDVFAGKTSPKDYNEAWWTLVRKYQGIDAPVARSETDFDPGAKYHIPANVPYVRYFLARVLQFQFHRALCRTAGHQGALHECSIYGNAAAGEKLKAMLALGSSKPWPDALEAMTGERQMDGSALIEYFEPLMEWLGQQNKSRQCGW